MFIQKYGVHKFHGFSNYARKCGKCTTSVLFNAFMYIFISGSIILKYCFIILVLQELKNPFFLHLNITTRKNKSENMNNIILIFRSQLLLRKLCLVLVKAVRNDGLRK